MMYEMPVEAGKIREFALATKSAAEVYQGRDAVVPPTFVSTAFHFWAPPTEPGLKDLGFDMARVLHGEEEFIFHGPLPRAGETLQVTTRLGERVQKQGKRGGTMTIAEVVHEFRDVSGSVVAEQRTSLIETAVAPETN